MTLLIRTLLIMTLLIMTLLIMTLLKITLHIMTSITTVMNRCIYWDVSAAKISVL
jgi:hypothetical protein